VIIFIPFTPDLDRSSFECGRPELDRWFREFAGQQERDDSARTTLAVDESETRIAAFFTLVAYRIEVDNLTESLAGRSRRYPMSALLLARMAVDRRYQGSGLGKIVLVAALKCAADVARDIGFEIVVVDAMDEDAACFYLKHGFRRFEDHSLKLFMTTKNLRATFDADQT